LAWATQERPSITDLLDHIFGAEAAHKLEQRIGRRIDTSGLVERKTLEAFEWDFQPKIDKTLILELARLDFVRRHEDLVITGMAGTGKSHILKAFGMRACEQAITMRYARCVDLLDDLHAGLADGTYPRRLKAWARPDLLIIDDVGVGQVKKRDDEPTAAHTLYNIIDRRHGRVSTAVTSNIALSDWGPLPRRRHDHRRHPRPARDARHPHRRRRSQLPPARRQDSRRQARRQRLRRR
jgi:DNA replication protein DnaC